VTDATPAVNKIVVSVLSTAVAPARVTAVAPVDPEIVGRVAAVIVAE
jgi:hypothetical protein